MTRRLPFLDAQEHVLIELSDDKFSLTVTSEGILLEQRDELYLIKNPNGICIGVHEEGTPYIDLGDLRSVEQLPWSARALSTPSEGREQLTELEKERQQK